MKAGSVCVEGFQQNYLTRLLQETKTLYSTYPVWAEKHYCWG